MLALSFYNHAFYDDYGFSLLTHQAWQDSGSLIDVFQAAVKNTVGIRQTWEGTYTTSFISTFQPAIFGEDAYWVTTFLLLGMLLLSLFYFLRQSLHILLGMDSASVAAAFGILGFVMVQFVPDAGESFYWFNGGVAYTLLWSLMLATAGAWIRFAGMRGRSKTIAFYLLLLVLTVLVGGAKYTTALFAVLSALCATVFAFVRKHPKKWAYVSLTVVLVACFVFSISAPGNAVRAKTLSGGMSPVKAVVEAVYFGLAFLGHSITLPLIAALVLLVALALPALEKSRCRFAHPVWFSLAILALFCTQLAPTLYTGNYLGDGRVLNTYYFTLVVLLSQLALYWAGFILRTGKRYFTQAALPAVSQSKTNRVRIAALLVAAVLLIVGCVSYHPDGSASYGPQNMAGGSALRSLISGQADDYDTAMDQRDAALNDDSQTAVILTPVTDTPPSFMGDALTSDNLDYVLSLYTEYYNKAVVQLTQGDE